MTEKSPVNPPSTEQLWITPESVASDVAVPAPQPPGATMEYTPAQESIGGETPQVLEAYLGPLPPVVHDTPPPEGHALVEDMILGSDAWLPPFAPPRDRTPREEGEFDFGPEDWFGSPSERVDLDPAGDEWDVDASGRRWWKVEGGTDWAPELEGWDFPIAEAGVEDERVGRIRRLGQFVGRHAKRLSNYDKSNISRRKSRENRIEAVKSPGLAGEEWVERARKRNHHSPEEVEREEHDLRMNPISFGARSGARFVMWNAGKLRRATRSNIADYAYETSGHWHGIEGHKGGSGRFVPRKAAKLVTFATRAESPKKIEEERRRRTEIDDHDAELREWVESIRNSGTPAPPTEDDDHTPL